MQLKSVGQFVASVAGTLLLGGCGSAMHEMHQIDRPELQACSPMPDGSARPVLISQYRPGIVLDGDLTDWRGVRFISVTPETGVFDQQPSPADSADDLSFEFAVCHDDEALYVAVIVTDDSISADSCEPGAISCPAWDDDAVEVFIDGNHNHAADSRVADGSELRYGGEFALVANGAANSDYSGYPRTFGRRDTWDGATNWDAVQRGEKQVKYEMRITWAMMGGAVRPGDTIGFTLSVQDDDGGGRRDHALYYVGNPKRPFSDERYFADLILLGE